MLRTSASLFFGQKISDGTHFIKVRDIEEYQELCG